MRKRLRAKWLPSTVTILCAWCGAAVRDMELAQVHNTGRAAIRCRHCGGHNTLPDDLLTRAASVEPDADPDNPPGRAEAWERLAGNQPLRRAMEIAIAGHHTLVYVGLPEFGWEEVSAIMGEWATTIQHCPCGNFRNHVHADPCVCTFSEIEGHRKTRPFQAALDSDLIVEALPPTEDDYWDNPEPYTDVLERVRSVRLSQAIGGGEVAQPKWRDEPRIGGVYRPRRMSDTSTFKLLNEAREKWSLNGRRLVSVQRVAHTIAGLEGSPYIEAHHVREALLFRAPLQDPNRAFTS